MSCELNATRVKINKNGAVMRGVYIWKNEIELSKREGMMGLQAGITIGVNDETRTPIMKNI
ncbi:hypothetical protein J6590_020107 [Homalodisca vitripennis]|nr:hypothetical protein J6590_020107 [Homalodisca vitripennis]